MSHIPQAARTPPIKPLPAASAVRLSTVAVFCARASCFDPVTHYREYVQSQPGAPHAIRSMLFYCAKHAS